MKICVAVTAKDAIYMNAARTLLALQKDLYDAGHEMMPIFLQQDSLLPRARDKIASLFIDHPSFDGYDFLLTMDSDISSTRKDAILRLIEADKDIIAGIYRVKSDVDYRPAVVPLNLDAQLEAFQNPVECEYVSTGFMLTKRKVFEVLKNRVQHYIVDKAKIYQFYPTPIVMQHMPDGSSFPNYLSEDWGFCLCARNAGFRIYGLDVGLAHEGLKAYVFEPKSL